MSTGLKKFLTGIMIAGDLLLGSVFFADMIAGYDFGLSLFMVIFLGIDMALSIDYVSKLSKEEKLKYMEEAEKKRELARKAANRKKKLQELDEAMAADIRSSTEVLDNESYTVNKGSKTSLRQQETEDELDPQELQDMLSGEQSQSQSQTRNG